MMANLNKKKQKKNKHMTECKERLLCIPRLLHPPPAAPTVWMETQIMEADCDGRSEQ